MDLLKDSDLENKRKLALAITTMVDPKILRYTSTGSLLWYGSPQQCKFQQ